MISMFFSATADWTGCPPNVIPWEYIFVPSMKGSITRSVVTTPPIAAYDDDKPLAIVIRSGRMS